MSGTETTGRRPTPDMLVDVDRLVGACYTERPDPSDPGRAVSFGTSGHRGSSLGGTFTESHIVAMRRDRAVPLGAGDQWAVVLGA